MSQQTSDIILTRMMSLHPKIIDLSLDRMHRLLARLDHPERHLPPVVHIAGTNGKGSTLAMIRAGMEGAGKRVHAYSSPHLARFHERIYLAGANIDEALLTDLLAECEAANGADNITYFEITTAAAFVAFARTPADFLLLEVGLGGRFDATNVIARPAACVITPVSIDHQQYLGNTLADIAFEKAGILKPGVPCIVGPQEPEALSVICARAQSLNAPLLVHNQDWQVWEEHGRLVFQDEDGLLDLPMPNLIGGHQVENAGGVLATLRCLGVGDPECAVTQARWPARLQRLRKGLLVELAAHAEIWLDGGHNPSAGLALAEAVTRLPDRPLHLICGMLNTKDIAGYLRPLAAIASTLHGVTIPGEAATLSGAETTAIAISVGLKAEVAASVGDAIRTITATDPNARILICGSLYLAGAVLRENG